MKTFVLLAVMYHPSGSHIVSNIVIGTVAAETAEGAARKLGSLIVAPAGSLGQGLSAGGPVVIMDAPPDVLDRLLRSDGPVTDERARRWIRDRDMSLMLCEAPGLA